MPLANVQQVNAPSFAGVGELLRGANDSFNNAFSSANSILAQYQEGQQAKSDALFLDTIKNATDEKSLTDILAKTDFTKMNLSPEMQKVALGMRDTVLGYDTTRISNNNMVDSNNRANANENRVQTDWVYGNNARDARNAMTPALLGAYVDGQTYGQAATGGGNGQQGPVAGSVGPTIFNGAEKQYGLPAGYLSTTAQIESSNNPNALNKDSGAAGLFQFIPSTAKAYGLSNPMDAGASTDAAARLAADNAATLRSKLGREPTAAELYLAHQQGAGGASSLLANPNARAADIVGERAVTLNGGDANMTAGEFASIWINKYNKVSGTPSGGGATPGPGGYTGGQANTYVQSPQMRAAFEAMASNPYLDPTTALGFTNDLLGAQVAGQTAISDRDAADQALRAAAAQNQIALDPTIMTDTQRQAAMLTTPGLNPLTAQKGAGDLNGLTAPGGALGAIATPAVTADPTVQAAVEQQNAADQLALSISGEARKQDLLTKFTSAEDPVAALVEQANETGGGSIFAGVDLDEDTRKAVQTLADAAGVSVPQMAATLADMTDPSTEYRGWGLNNRPSLETLLGSVQDGGLGTLRQFFNDPTGNSPSGKDAIIAQAKEDAALAAGYTGKATANLKSAADREATQNRIQTTQSQIAKLAAINPSDPQIAILQKQLQDLKQGLFNNATPTQDAIARVKMYTPGSPDHARELAALSAAIDADPGIKDKAGAKKALGITP